MPINHVNGDLARQWTTTTGTGTLAMGSVPTGLRSIVAAVGSGKKARFKLSASDGVSWEIFEGVATAGTPDTVTRDTVISSTNGGSKIVLPAGTHTLECTWIAKSADEATPRLLTVGNGITLASGTLTLDCMGSCDVFAALALTANVTAIVLQNVPERCSLYLEVTQSGGPWTFPQAAWPSGTVLDSAYNLYTDATKSRFWWTTTNGGASSCLECNGPAAGATGDAYAVSHESDTTAHPASSIVNTPAGGIAATTVQAALNELDSEKSAVGHTHTGVYDPAGTASSAVSAHVAAGDPHTQYALESAFSNVANVDQLPRTAEVVTVTGNTTVSATHNGKIIDCNSASAITLTFADALTAGFQCFVLRSGAGTVAIARQTSGTLNGAATSISVSAQWKTAFVFAYGTGTFAVDAG